MFLNLNIVYLQFQDVKIERDLDELQLQIKNDQYEPKNTALNEFVYFYNKSNDNSNEKFLIIHGEYSQSEEYKITVFIVNKLNEARKVSRKSINGTNIYDIVIIIYQMFMFL